jgi:hypothetical protein
MKTTLPILFRLAQGFIPPVRTAAVLVLGLTLFTSGSQAQDYAWARKLTNHFGRTRVATSPDGNYFAVMGEFNETILVNSYMMTSRGSTDVFVIVFRTSNNAPVFGKRIGGTGTDKAGDLVFDPTSQYLYVTGSFSGTADLDNFRPGFLNHTVSSAGGSDIFLARYYIGTGSLSWSLRAGSTLSDESLAITVDPSGSVLLTGYVNGNATFSSDRNASPRTVNLQVDGGYRDTFVAKYTSDGIVQWAKQPGIGRGDDFGAGIAVDGSGNIFVAGAFSHNFTFYSTPFSYFTMLSTSTPTGLGNTNMFIVKLNSSGNFLWANRAGGTSLDSGSDLVVDGHGNAYVTGSYYSSSGITFFRNLNHTSTPVITLGYSGSGDSFLVKYTPGGGVAWARMLQGTGNDYASAITRDTDNNVYVAGHFTGHITFSSAGTSAPTVLVAENAADRDAFIVKYNPAGSVLWARKSTGTASTRNQDIAAGPRGAVFFTGYAAGAVGHDTYFGSHAIFGTGCYVARFNQLWLTMAPPTISFGREAAVAEVEAGEADIRITARPNPFSYRTIIEFQATSSGPASLQLFDSKGGLIDKIFEGDVESGKQYTFEVNGSHLSAGMYISRLTTPTKTFNHKLIVTK